MIQTISCFFCPFQSSFNDDGSPSLTLTRKCANCGTDYSFNYPSNQLNWVRYRQKGKTVSYDLTIDYVQHTTVLTKYRGESYVGKILVSLVTALPSIQPQQLPKMIKSLKRMKAFA